MDTNDIIGGTPSTNNISRRSKKVKNLEQEVELILSQEEDNNEEEATQPKTPVTSGKNKDAACLLLSTEKSVLQDLMQTPRRSCRKSIKPPQDYEDIIVRSLRSVSRSAKKNLTSISEPNENMEIVEDEPKWSASKVGRSSTKRGRKSKRNKGKQSAVADNENKESLAQDNANVRDNLEETIDEKQGAYKKQLDMDVTENIMESSQIPLNNFKEILKTIPGEAEIEDIVAEETIDENHVPYKKQLDMGVTDSIMENSQISSNNFKEILKTVQDEAKIEVIVAEEMPENKKCSTQSLEDQNQPIEEIFLVDDDSEDCKELPVKEEQDISSESKYPIYKSSANKGEEQDDSFGCYLKSKEINIEDLGLNPIDVEDETDDKPYADTNQYQETEEMPSLLVCDDEADEMKEKGENCDKSKLNTTFDAENSVVLIADGRKSAENLEMEALKMSDDESECIQGSSAKKASSVMFMMSEEQNQALLSTPKQVSKSQTRLPTPYRSRATSKLRKEIVASPNKTLPAEENENFNMTISSLTTMEPKDIVLRGIRKRSLSVCLGTEEGVYLTRSAKRNRAVSRRHPRVQKAVNFYSPANQTTIIEDLDKLIAKSVKKNENSAEQLNSTQNVTTRRKRSLSLDDSMMSKSFSISKLPRPVSNQTSFLNATSTTALTSTSNKCKPMRTKLPNFAAIHQRQFQKMENLIDHVKRKQERSNALINSANKIRPASAQKNITSNVMNRNNQSEKPKAYKRIDMTSQSQITTKSISYTGTHKKIPSAQNKIINDDKASKLPDPRNILLSNTAKSSSKPNQMPLVKKHLKPTQAFNVSSVANATSKQKPTFNLSTQIGGKTTSTSSSSTSSTNTSILGNKTLSVQDKMTSRLQRHMDMFKVRDPAARAGGASRKNEASIRGVRSNRRFELQMQHRRNLEN